MTSTAPTDDDFVLPSQQRPLRADLAQSPDAFTLPSQQDKDFVLPSQSPPDLTQNLKEEPLPALGQMSFPETTTTSAQPPPDISDQLHQDYVRNIMSKAKTPDEQSQAKRLLTDEATPPLPVQSPIGSAWQAANTTPQFVNDIAAHFKQSPQNALIHQSRQMLAADEVSPPAAQDEGAADVGNTAVSRGLSGTAGALLDIPSFFTTPLGIATLGIGTLPKVAQRLVAGAFSAQMASQTPEIKSQLEQELGKPAGQRDPEKIANLITAGLLNTGFSVAGAAHAVAPEFGHEVAKTPVNPPGAKVVLPVDPSVSDQLGADFTKSMNAPETSAARTPDGQTDAVRTGINKMRAESKDAPVTVAPASESQRETPSAPDTIAARAASAPDKPVTMADLAQLQSEMRGNQLKPSEPLPAAIAETRSQPDEETASPSRPVAPVLNISAMESELVRRLQNSGQVASSDFTIEGIKKAMGLPSDKQGDTTRIAPMIDVGLIERTSQGLYRFNENIQKKGSQKLSNYEQENRQIPIEQDAASGTSGEIQAGQPRDLPENVAGGKGAESAVNDTTQPNSVKPSLYDQYQDLASQFKTAPVEQKFDIQSQIEAIKNQNGGMVPEKPAEIAETKQDALNVSQKVDEPVTTSTPVSTHSFKVGDKVLHQGQIKTVTKAIPGGDYVGVGNRAINVKELKPAQDVSISEKANSLADRLESLKSGAKGGAGGQLHAFGLAADLWDRAVSIAQGVVRAGGSIAEAISAAISHIKSNHKGAFDEPKARFALLEKAQNEGASVAGEAPSEAQRPLADVKSDFEDAEANLKKATVRGDTKTQSKKDYSQQAAVAAARYRTVRDELKTHPERIAEVLKESERASREARAARDAGDTEKARQLEAELQDHIGDLDRLPAKMVARIRDELISKGELPKEKMLEEKGLGRTLGRMTKNLKKGEFYSPKATLAERLAIGRRAADAVAGTKDFLRKVGLRSVAAFKSFAETVKNPPKENEYKSAKKSWIQYDEQTAHENYEYAKAIVGKVSQPIRRKAISVWLDADGDEGLLKFQADSVPDKYRPIWETALRLTPDEKRIAQDIKEGFDEKLNDAVDTGMLKAGREDYGVPQRWKVAPQIDKEPDPYGESKKGSPGNPNAVLDDRDPFFAFRRESPTYFDGIMKGGEPENLDVAHLVTVYDQAFHKSLGSRGFIRALNDATAHDGRPVVKISGKASTARNDDGTSATFVDSKAHSASDVSEDGRPYVSVDHPAMKGWKIASKDADGNPIFVKGDMLVHPDYVSDLKNELETPRWTKEGIGNKILKANAFLKASKFIGPFHIVTEALHAAFHGVVPSVKDFHIDLNDPKQALLSRNMTLGFGKAREMFEDGLSSQKGIWAKVPGLGDAIVKMNNFTFNEYIPRLKMKVGLAVLDRNQARYGKELSQDQIAEITGKQMDAAFGGQNWRLMGANKNLLAVARLGLLTPDFTISRAKVIGQAFTKYGAEQRHFLFAQAVGVYAIARALNAIFSDDHDPHFEFKNWDSVVIGKKAYHARFIVSDAANLARDLLGLSDFHQNGVPFITGRLGVLPKVAIETATGKDLFTGANKDGLYDSENPALKAFSIVAKDVAEWMTPMGVDGFLPGATKRGQSGLGSAIAATVGVTGKKQSAVNDVWGMARNFNLENRDQNAVRYQKERDNDSHGVSDYHALDNLLDAGDFKDAKEEYQRLLSTGRTPQVIARRYDRVAPFTGSLNRERNFIASLSPDQRKVYQQARTEQQERAARFLKVLR